MATSNRSLNNNAGSNADPNLRNSSNRNNHNNNNNNNASIASILNPPTTSSTPSPAPGASASSSSSVPPSPQPPFTAAAPPFAGASNLSYAELSNLGNAFKAAGDFEKAKQCYVRAIQLNPQFAIAWHNLGSCYRDEGNLAAAMQHYQQAILLDPMYADAYNNMGNTFKDWGRLDEAIACYRKTLEIAPHFAIAYGNLGNVYLGLGDIQMAEALYRHALQLDPNLPDVYSNLGNALKAQGKINEAIECYKQCLALQPNHANAYNNLGNIMKESGRAQEAEQCYLKALAIAPRFPAVCSNLANLYLELGRTKEALRLYDEAVSIDSTFADVFSNRGNALKSCGRLQEAIASYQRAIELKPDFADAHSNLASVFKDMALVDQAIAYYQKAISLKPYFPDAIANLLHCLQMVCDWRNRDQNFDILRSILAKQLQHGELPAAQPHHSLFYPLTPEQMLMIAKAYAAKVEANVAHLKPYYPPPHEVAKYSTVFQPLKPGERLRIGYVSSDFGDHPLSQLMRSVFCNRECHDRSRVEVFCYSLSHTDNSDIFSDIEKGAEHFIDITDLPTQEAAELIYNDRIHILVNLNGYTAKARNEIFALRPAPIQILCMGYPGSMGAHNFIEYMVADEIIVPPSSPRHLSFHSEKMIYMPSSFFVNDHRQNYKNCVPPEAELPTLEYMEFPEDAKGKFILCNFNQLWKIDPTTLDLWARILKRLGPDRAILWLLRFPKEGEANIRREARLRGIPDSQLFFTNVITPKQEFIRCSGLGHLFLDTLLCNAHTTGTDVLWAGVPMITMPGETMATRVAASLVTAVGCGEEMIANSLQEYEDKAVELALNPEKYKALRSKLEANRYTHPLFDTRRWTRDLEDRLLALWDHKCAITAQSSPAAQRHAAADQHDENNNKNNNNNNNNNNRNSKSRK